MKKLLSNPSLRRVVASPNGNGHSGRNAHNGDARNVGVDPGRLKTCSTVHDQARELTSLFVSLTRQLLVLDDFVAEMPLRQLRVCMLLYDGSRSMSVLSRELGVSLSAMTQ